MIAIFVSECNKQALEQTRLILDQFSTRIGGRTWMTHVTENGLETIHKKLLETARKNTLVQCFTVFGKTYTHRFTVGNASKVSIYNAIPTNTTSKLLNSNYIEKNFFFAKSIALLTCLAGLFHDFGKGSSEFQKKLRAQEHNDTVRHEYVSAVFLYSLAQEVDDDLSFLAKLKSIVTSNELRKITITSSQIYKTLDLSSLSSHLAQSIIYLVLTHHRLCVLNEQKPYSITNASNFDNLFNKYNDNLDKKFQVTDFKKTYLLAIDEEHQKFEINIEKTLFCSKEFQKRLLSCIAKIENFYFGISKYFGIDNVLVLQLARTMLNLADHITSTEKIKGNSKIYHDPNYDEIWANTYKNKKNQLLDDHTCKVATLGYLLSITYFKYEYNLPCITDYNTTACRSLRKISSGIFDWQNKSYNLAKSFTKSASENGFFGINCASTGKGKTFANAKIMFAINGENDFRLSYTTTLRTLTKQAAKTFKEKLYLDKEVVTKVGGQYPTDLSDIIDTNNTNQTNNIVGSDASSIYDEPIFNEKTLPSKTYFGKIIGKKLKEHQIAIESPILISTLDYLIGLSEGVSGGHQIKAALRLFKNNVIIDELDEISVTNQLGLVNFVYHLGMFGAKVIISSATINIPLAWELFKSYYEGRSIYNKTFGSELTTIPVGLFTEHVQQIEPLDIQDFNPFKNLFTSLKTHFLKLKDYQNYQLTKTIEIKHDQFTKNYVQPFASTIFSEICNMSKLHKVRVSGKTIAIGLVRLVHIDKLVNITKEIIKITPPSNTHITYIVYHSHFTLQHRSNIEKHLDFLLNRTNDDYIKSDLIQNSFKNFPDVKNHVFIVLASPIAEIGRDHDYDFAIIEPSSFRSIVQCAGRVQRHRYQKVLQPNIAILNYNIKAFNNLIENKTNYCYVKPGFEIFYSLDNHNLYKFDKLENQYITPEQATLPLKEEEKTCNLANIETKTTSKILKNSKFITKTYASLYQDFGKMFPIRDNDSNYQGFLEINDESDFIIFKIPLDNNNTQSVIIKRDLDIEKAENVSLFNPTLLNVTNDQDSSVQKEIYNQISVPLYKNIFKTKSNNLRYSDYFGVFRIKEQDES